MRNPTRLIGAVSAQPNHSDSKREEFSGGRPRGITALALAGLLGLLNSVACGSSSSSSNEDANRADTPADTQQIPDVSTPVGPDASVDTSMNASVDAPVDALVDAPVSVSGDAPVNASVDAASVDASVGAFVDASVNTSVDAPVDTLVGAPVDAFVCTPADGGMPGTICAEGQVCSDGICQTACGVGLTLCEDGVCHDLMNENTNCGWCGSECSLDKQCGDGQCMCIVPDTCPL